MPPPTPAGAAGTTAAGTAYLAGRARQAASPGAAAVAAPTPPVAAEASIGDDLEKLWKSPSQYDLFGRSHFETPTGPMPDISTEPFRYSSGKKSRFVAGPTGAAEDLAKSGGPGVGRGLFTKREMDTVSKIPTSLGPITKDTIKEMARNGEKLPPYLQDIMGIVPKAPSKAAQAREAKAAAAASQVEDTKLINEAVAAKATENPSVIHPVDGSNPPSVVMPESTGNRAADAIVTTAGGKPAQVTAEVAEKTAAATGRSLAETAAEVAGKPATVIATAARKAGESPTVSLREQYTKVQELTRNSFVQARAETATYQEAKNLQQARVMEKLAEDKAGLVTIGRYPEVTTIAGSTYKLHAHDIYEAVGPKVTAKMQFSNWDIPISSQIMGAARAIELAQAHVDEATAIAEIADTMKKAHHTQKSFDKRATDYARDMWNARDELYRRAVDNEALFKTRDAVIGRKIGDDIGTEVKKIIDDPSTGTGAGLAAVANIPKATSKAAAASGGSAGAAAVGSATAADNLASHVITSDVETARHVQSQSRLQANNAQMNGKGNQSNPYRQQPGQQHQARRRTTTNNNRTINMNQQRFVNQQINNIHAAAALAGVARVDVVAVTTDGLFRRMMDGFLGAISGGYGMGMLFPVGRQAFNHHGDISIGFNKIVQRAREAHDPIDVQRAFSVLQNRGPRPTSPAEAAAYDDLVAMTKNNVAMSQGINSWGDANSWRNGYDLDTIQQVMRKKGIEQEYRPKDNHLEVPEQWREWQNIDDPIGFLIKHHEAQMELAGHASVGRYFSKEMGSKVKQPGMEKIARSPDVDLSHYIDRDLWYHKHDVDMLRRYNLEVAKNVKFNNKLMNDYIDPYISAWKTSATVMRVGHILRNFIGDTMFTGMDGAKYMNPANNKKALEVQRSTGGLAGFGGVTGRSTKESVVDDLRRLNELLDETPPKPTGKALSVTLKNGQKQDISYNQVQWYAHQAGLLMDYRHLEDILEARGGGLNKILDPIKDSKFINAMGKASEVSSNNARLAHLIGLMQDGKVTNEFTSVEAMVRSLGTRVLKFHPDASGLTKFEQKYMRRAIPFYTWFKQAAPTMFMTTLTHPARPMAITKANYNAQIAMGGDPKSPEDPFTSGNYYPNFFRQQLLGPLAIGGKQGTIVDWGSPTEAMASVLNSDNPAAAIAAMTNPIPKTIAGLIQGHQPLANEAYIPDQSEWIDRSVPYVNQLSAISGISVTGSLEELLTSGKIDEQRAVEKGEKDFMFNQNMANYWSPFSIQNTDRPSFFNIARRENQQLQEERDPNLLLKDRLLKAQHGLPPVYTGKQGQ
jgi:hypothetical protein